MAWPHVETRDHIASRMKDFILGWQDGVVNVLALVLGVASATNNEGLVIIAGLAGTFAESISMAAVAYTSSRAEADFYRSEVEREKYEMRHMPEIERREIREVYRKKGFRGRMLENIVRHITASRPRWLRTMMTEELMLFKPKISPLGEAVLVGLSAVLGSLIPLIAFFLMPVGPAIITTLIISATVLFVIGAIKARLTVGNPIISGIEMAAIGMAAAIAGYGIGSILGTAHLAG